MKRWTSALLVGILCFTAASAAAQETASVAVPEGMALLRFMGYGFQIAVPLDWQVAEITEEERKKAGVIFIAQNEAGDQQLTVLRREEEKALTAEQLLEWVRETDPAAEAAELNGVQMVCSRGNGDGAFYVSGEWDYEPETLTFRLTGDAQALETMLSVFAWLEE